MITRFKICWICATVSSLWLVMSALAAWQAVSLTVLQLPIALLMGGSVVGIAYQRHSRRWKITAIVIGMPAAFMLVTNLTKVTVFIELVVLLSLFYALFVQKENNDNNFHTRKLEEQMKQCC